MIPIEIMFPSEKNKQTKKQKQTIKKQTKTAATYNGLCLHHR